MIYADNCTSWTDDAWISWASSSTVTWTNWTGVTTWHKSEVGLIAPKEVKVLRAEADRVEVQRIQRRTTARSRAKELLRQNLTVAQMSMLEKEGRFRFGKFEMEVGHHGKLYELDGDKRVKRLCFYPRLPMEMDQEFDGVPDYDSMLAQKLLVEANEQAMRAVAVETVLN